MVQVQPEESNSEGKAVIGSSSEEPKPAEVKFECPRCFRTFNSAPALCGHQNAHRLVKQPTKISPVLAAVLNNPLPPDDKPALITPRRPKPGANPTRFKELVSKQPGIGNASPRCQHPYRRQGKEPTNPHDKPEGEGFLRQLLIEKGPRYHPFERVLPEYNQDQYTHPQCLITRDLLGEWMPITGFRDHGQLGTSYGEQTLSDAILRTYQMGREAGLENTGSKTSAGHLDLELKLGF